MIGVVSLKSAHTSFRCAAGNSDTLIAFTFSRQTSRSFRANQPKQGKNSKPFLTREKMTISNPRGTATKPHLTIASDPKSALFPLPNVESAFESR